MGTLDIKDNYGDFIAGLVFALMVALYFFLIFMLGGCGEPYVPKKTIKIAEYISPQFNDVKGIHETTFHGETEHFYIVNTTAISKNPSQRTDDNYGLWEDGDRVKEGKLCEEQ